METWMIEHSTLATLLIVTFTLLLIAAMPWLVHRVHPHEATRSQVTGALVSFAITLVLSVFLNNVLAKSRDRDNRLRTFRDQHFAQLRPVLRTESSKLQGLSEQIIKEGHISKVAKVGAEQNPSLALWPDVLSQDLRNHFADYDAAKRALLSEIASQDDEFRNTLSLADSEMTQKPDAYWREIVALSFVEMCLGRQTGIKLTITSTLR